tara:strand:- start:576 stop:1202 length:627 start_codon:yes stop_codon:yes gene_type:complete
MSALTQSDYIIPSNQSSKNMSKTFVEKNEHFITNSNDANGISLCIPRMFNNIGFRRVKGVFIKQNWGFVERVDVIHYGDHKKAFVHFRPNSWNWTKRNQQILEQLQRGEQIHLRYESGKPWFWHVGISYTETPKQEDVNYFPTGVINLNTKVPTDEQLLNRKRENQKTMRVNDDPILARMNEGSPKNNGREIINSGDSYDPMVADTFA